MRQFVPRSIWSALQYAKTKFITWRFRNRSVKHNYGGHILEVHLHDPISAQWYDRDWQRLKEFDVLAKSRLRNSSTVFDIGAHQSVVAMMLAKEVGASGRVIAVEPNPFNVRVAMLNLASNGITNVTEVHAMVSSSSGTGHVSFQLNSTPADAESGSWGRKVRSVTINQLASEFGIPDVIYLDVEGYECKAVMAADDVLSHPTDWCVELHGDDVLRHFGSSNADIVRRFVTEGFDVFIIDGQSGPVEIDEMRIPTGRCHMIAIR
jgi:FkbM family methyltransferase